MKKLNTRGFSAVEALLIFVFIGIVGFVGWYVWSVKTKTNTKQASTQPAKVEKQPEAPKAEVKKSTPYTFKELGITMDVLAGWEVKSSTTKDHDVNVYDWTVQKEGADGKISLSSTAFQGGFMGCEDSDLTAVTVNDAAPTNNSKLTFLSWTYEYSSETVHHVLVAGSDETSFRTTNSSSAAALKNKDVKPGKYFFCMSEPYPGFSLELNKEAAAPSYSRKDGIAALSSTSTSEKYVPLAPTAASYAEIKTMLTSIK
jgi:hypothetical protein